jgi:hypothetical protein
MDPGRAGAARGARLRLALADPATRGRWLVALTVLVALIAATVAFTIGRDPSGRPTARPYADAPYYYAYAPTLLLDRDLDLRDEYVITGNWYRLAPTKLGRPGNVFGVGPAIVTAPAFLVGHAIAVATGERRDGFSTTEQWLTMWMSVLASVTALIFPVRIASRRLRAPGAGLIAAVCALCAGPVIYYAVRQPGYAHPFATFFAAWLVDLWDASYLRPRSARTWALLGLALGLAVLARPQLAPWAILPLLAAVDDLARARGRVGGALFGRWLLGAAVALLALLPQLLAWRALYGALYVLPQGAGFMRWDEPAWTEVLFSSRNGLLPWAPLYAVGLAGAVIGAWRWPRLFVPLLVGVAAQVWANGAAWDWWGGGAFGGRRFDSIYVVVALGLAVVLAPAVAALARLRLWPLRQAAWRVPAALAGIVALAFTLALTAGNLIAASKYSAPSVRIGGGTAASTVLRDQIKGRLGRFVGRVSGWTNYPFRLDFAHRYARDLGAYDQVIGTHFLGETFPGLNSTRPRTEDRLTMREVPGFLRPGFRGGGPDGALVMADGHGRLLVGLNRRGGVSVTITLWHPGGASGEVALRWNDRERVRVPVPASPTPIELIAPVVRRGVNLLEIDAPPGTVASELVLQAIEE